MSHDQVLELLLFLQEGSSFLSISITGPSPPGARSILILRPSALGDSGITHQLCNVIVLVFIIASLVSRMVDAQHSSKDSCSTEIVHCKIRASLVFVFEKRKASTLASFLVAN